MGRNGKNSAAPAMLNMLPKFELAPIRMYLVTFSTVRRPSIIAVMHHVEIVLEQDEIGSLLGDVGGAVDRDADIGRMQRRGVVDAVAEKAGNFAACASRPRGCAPSAAALMRQNRLTDARRARSASSDMVTSSCPVSTPLNGDADRLADMDARPLVVAGQDLDVDADGRKRAGWHRRHRPWAGRRR